MKLVETFGPFSYRIDGNSETDEAAAAEALNNAIDFLIHDFSSTNSYQDNIEDSQRSIEKRYNVKISIYQG